MEGLERPNRRPGVYQPYIGSGSGDQLRGRFKEPGQVAWGSDDFVYPVPWCLDSEFACRTGERHRGTRLAGLSVTVVLLPSTCSGNLDPVLWPERSSCGCEKSHEDSALGSSPKAPEVPCDGATIQGDLQPGV